MRLWAESVAVFFVVNVDVLTFLSCILGVVIHFFMEKRPHNSGEAFKTLMLRVAASANIPMVPALLSCALFSHLVSQLSSTTFNFFVAAVASAYMIFFAFSD